MLKRVFSAIFVMFLSTVYFVADSSAANGPTSRQSTTQPGILLDDFRAARGQITAAAQAGSIEEYQKDVEFALSLRLGCSNLFNYKLVHDEPELKLAMQRLEHACELRPSSSAAQLYAGEALMQTGKGGDAVRHFLAVAPNATEYAKACYDLSLGFAMMAEGHLQESIAGKMVKEPADPHYFYSITPVEIVSNDMRQEWLMKSAQYLQSAVDGGISKPNALYAKAYLSYAKDTWDLRTDCKLTPATFQAYVDYLQSETVTALNWRGVDGDVSLLDAYGVKGIPDAIRRDLKPWQELGAVANGIKNNAGILSNIPAQVMAELFGVPPNPPILSITVQEDRSVIVTFSGANKGATKALARVKEAIWSPVKAQKDGDCVANGQISPSSYSRRSLQEIKLPAWDQQTANVLIGKITGVFAMHGQVGYTPDSVRAFDEPWLRARVVECKCSLPVTLIQSINTLEDVKLAIREAPSGFNYVKWKGTETSGKLDFAIYLFFAMPERASSLQSIQ